MNKTQNYSNLPLIIVSNSIDIQENFIDQHIIEKKIIPYLVFRIKPVKDEISIEQIREVKKELVVFNKDKRLFVIYSFDNSSIEAQNALLKTLEEKTGANQFILLAANINRVLPTIQSRCKIVRLETGSSPQNQAIFLYIDKLKSDHDYSFLAAHEITGINKAEAVALIDKLLNYFKEKLMPEAKLAPSIVRKCLQVRKLIQDNNLNPQLAIDNLLIFINKLYNMKSLPK